MVSPGGAPSTQPGAWMPPDRFVRRLTIGFWLVALVLGGFEAWISRFDMNPDGIQYLDNAALYAQGDLRNAINTQWSPLYPWLIAGAEAIARPSRETVFAVAHLVNFAVYVASIGCFLFFVKSVQRRPPASFLVLSYAAFLYSSLDFTHLRYVTPDLLVNCFAFGAAALVTRIANGQTGVRNQAALGILLGVGYLAKAPFLPIGIFCLVLALISGRARAMVSVTAFLCVTAPYMAALWQSKHHFTFGDSAKLNLAWHVDRLPSTNWQGGPPENGRPLHPTRQLSVDPAIFEFAEPIAGTYPLWYDPPYWNDGVRVTYPVGPLIHAIAQQVRLYAYLVHHRQIPLVFALIALALMGRGRGRVLARLRSAWPVLALAAIGFAMYAPVHAEGRYLASFFALFWTAAFACAAEDTRASMAIAVTATFLMIVETAAATVAIPPDEPPARPHFQIARDLRKIGVKPGERIAMVSGLPYYWAYLSGAKVIVQISFTPGDSSAQEAEWRTARQILESQMADFVVSPGIDGVTNQPGWIPIGTLPGAPPSVFAYPIHPQRAY